MACAILEDNGIDLSQPNTALIVENRAADGLLRPWIHPITVCAANYRIASLFPGAAAFLTSLTSRTPFSYVASHADSSSSTGSVKLR